MWEKYTPPQQMMDFFIGDFFKSCYQLIIYFGTPKFFCKEKDKHNMKYRGNEIYTRTESVKSLT